MESDMAKADFPTWMKFVTFILCLAGTVFTWGVAYSSHHSRITNVEKMDIIQAGAIKINGDNLETHKEKNADHEAVMTERVHTIERNQERDIALKENLLKSMVRLEANQDSFNTEMAEIKLDVNTTKVKVETLTRD